jgi:MoaA/NifB/PqqE/SkfB family radical SAM enzyme
VFGNGSEIFGRWNALVAVHSAPGSTVFRAHGGEIIPGTIDDHIDRIRHNVASGTEIPVQVDMDISMACPSACLFCFSAEYRSARTTGRLMEPELMLSLIRQSAQLGVKVVRFDGGGDPLTHPALPRAIDLCQELGMRTAVLTAGDLLSERLIPTFLNARTYVRVSLNAAEDTTRNAVHHRPGSRYGVRRIFDVVRCLADQRDAAFGSAGYAEMPIGATSMIHPLNAAETIAIAENAKRAGFDHLSFRVILGEALRADFTKAARSQLADAFDRIRNSVADDKFQVFLPTRNITDDGYIPSLYFSRCRASTHRALIEVGPAPERAALIPCGRYRGSGYSGGPDADGVVFAHLSSAEPLEDVWMDQHMRQLLGSFPRRCKDCIDRSANIFLETVTTILQADPQSVFVPFAVPSPSGVGPNA